MAEIAWIISLNNEAANDDGRPSVTNASVISPLDDPGEPDCRYARAPEGLIPVATRSVGTRSCHGVGAAG